MRALLLAAMTLTAGLARAAAADEADAPHQPPVQLEPAPAALELIGGAPLHDPNVAVHTVQHKSFEERGKHELVLFPAAVQVNPKFTQHVGTGLSYVYHLHENFGLQASGLYNWSSRESAFNQELITKVREEAIAASSLLLVWGAVAGVEVTPLYGKFAFYEGTLVQFTLVINGGVGVGSTRHELRPAANGLAASYGDTGLKLLGSVGGGFRFQIGERFALRLELRDLVYTARVDRVNGCDAGDLSAMKDRLVPAEGNLDGVSVSSGCRSERFNGHGPTTDDDPRLDVPLAAGLVETPTSDALNNLGVYAGFSVMF